MTEKILFVHAGGSKTGSSALQNFCENNASRLEVVGLAYEHRINIKSDYEINSGNGKILYKALSLATTTDNEIDSLVLSYFGGFNRAICSCEFFQYTDSLGWRKLLESSVRLGVKLKIIFYVRNVIPFLLSAYDQVIKRHGEWRLFDEWVVNADWPHPRALRRITDELPREIVHVIHFDQTRNSLIRDFLDVHDVDPSFEVGLTDQNRQVNRSLTEEERELLKAVNRAIGEVYSGELSDLLIYENPNLKAEAVFFNKSTTELLSNRFNDEIDWINNIFFDGQSVVSILPIESLKKTSNKNTITKLTKNSDIKKLVLDWSLEKLQTFQVESDKRLLKKINLLITFAHNHLDKSYFGVPEDFDALAYMLIYQDVFHSGMDPLYHYVNHGKSEGRLHKFPKGESSSLHRFNKVPDWMINNSLNNITYLVAGIEKKDTGDNLLNNSLNTNEFGKRDLDWSLEQLKIIKDRSDRHLSLFLNALSNVAQQYSGKLHPALPAHFDLFAYLVLNPEVLYADVEPIQHFFDYGKKERKAYFFKQQQSLMSRLWRFFIRRFKLEYRYK